MPKLSGSLLLSRLQVSDEDITVLRSLGAALENEIVSMYEAFISRRRQVDQTHWKLVRSTPNLRAYQELQEAVDAKCLQSATVSRASAGPQAHLAAESRCPRVLVTGTEAGTVDDAMYGCSFHDTVSLRTHEAYQRAYLDDSAVLCRIDGPTQDDPYQFLGLAWHLRAARVGTDRDCLLLQQTRLTTLSTGERIGISMRHSVEHSDLPELVEFSTIRIVISAVTIFRQHDADNIDLFAVEFMDERRRGPEAVQVHESARDVMACTSECDTGFKKKLHWLMRQRLHQARASGVQLKPRPDKNRCEVCNRSTKGFFKKPGATCQLCAKYVCTRCMVMHEIVLDASTPSVVAKPFGFCVECILHAKKAPTLPIAREDLASRVTAGGKTERTSAHSSRSIDLNRSKYNY